MRVVVADDSILTREGLVHLLTSAGIEVVAQAGDGKELLQLVAALSPDAVVVDVRMPPTHTDEGLVAAARIASDHPGVGVLVLSQYVEASYALRLINERPEGVGYLLKERVLDGTTLADALDRIRDGQTVVDPHLVERLLSRRRTQDPLAALSEREREVLGLVAQGLSNKAIADHLVVSERTVEAHLTRTFLKLGIAEDTGSHKRVLATLTYLRSSGS